MGLIFARSVPALPVVARYCPRVHRNLRRAACGALIAVLGAGLGGLVVAWASEDTAPQVLGAQRQAADMSAPGALIPVPTVVATAAPMPEPETTTQPSSPSAAQVRGITVTRPDPPPATEPPPATDPPPPPPPCVDAGGTGSLVGDLLNSHRSIRCQNGLGDVALDGSMNDHAQFHAQRLMGAGACNNLFHSTELSAWYSGAGAWGENLACIDWSGGCWGDAAKVMDMWMASPEHRANILNPSYHWMGIGVACDGRRTYFVTQFRS
jgi:uncharacterized protein YkwD